MSIIACVVSNVAIATLLALVATLIGRVTTKPQITHTLWLLVLVKLVTPPIIHIPVSYPVSELVALESPVDSADVTHNEPLEDLGTDVANSPSVPNSSMPNHKAGIGDSAPTTAPQESWGKALVSVWIAGSLLWFLLATTRLIRFKTLLRYASPASEELQAEVRSIASRYVLRNTPQVLVANANVPPLIWSFGRGTCMVLPRGLLDNLGADERAGLLAHELAHLKRYDHWIRWFEFVVLGICWWNPIAWWARSQVQQAEEECCDGWVLWAFPGKARLYAQTLVDTVDFLALGREVKPDIATAFNQGNSLQRRIEMILRKRVSRQLSWRIRILLLFFALAVAPLSLLAQSGCTEKKVGESPIVAKFRRSHSKLRAASRNVQGEIRVFRSETVIPAALEKLPADIGIPLFQSGSVWRSGGRFRADFKMYLPRNGVAKESQHSRAVDGGRIYEFSSGVDPPGGMLQIYDMDTPEAAAVMRSIESTFYSPLDALWSSDGMAFVDLLQRPGTKIVPNKSQTLPGGYSLLASAGDGSEMRCEFEPAKNHPLGYLLVSVRAGNWLVRGERRVFSVEKEGVLFPARVVNVVSLGPDNGYTEVVMLDLKPLEANSPIASDITPASFQNFGIGYQVYNLRKSGKEEIAERYEKPPKVSPSKGK